MKKRSEKLSKKFNNLGRKQLLLIALSMVLLIGAVLGGAITLSRYLSEDTSDGALSAKDFYFESNILKVGGAEYEIYSDTLKFDLMNYADELRCSSVSITYNVTITSADGGSLGEGTNTSGTITSGSPEKATVTYTGLTRGKTYTVTASATNPYTKTVSATFTIAEGNYDIITSKRVDKTPNENYVELTIRTLDFEGNITINWQSGYVPDNSEPILETASGNSHSTKLESYSVYTLKFFKTDDNVTYNAAAFTVSES